MLSVFLFYDNRINWRIIHKFDCYYDRCLASFSQLAGFIISVLALSYSKLSANKNFSYGYLRAEIVGALTSIFIIWILNLLLLIESITHMIDSHHKVDKNIMFITSIIG